MKWTTLFLFCVVSVSIIQAVPTGEPCINAAGVRAQSWSRCAGTCCTEQCTCVEFEGREQADCNTLCAALNYGCRALPPIQNETHMECCRTECQEPSCRTAFGETIPLNGRWTECLEDQKCCSAHCQCIQLGSFAQSLCRRMCNHYAVLLNEGCYIDKSFQNATYQNCCNVKCPGQPGYQEQPVL